MSVVDTILRAIHDQRVLAFSYKGEERTAEPYILGYDDKGTLVLSAVQLSGGSGTGFRSFHVNHLTALRITGRIFRGKHPDYYPRDPYFERILGQV